MINKGLLGADKYWKIMTENSNITLSEFRMKLNYLEICKFIKTSSDWSEIIANCQNLDF